MTSPRDSFPTAQMFAGRIPAGIRPDWLLFGWRRGGKCWLMASEDVQEATAQPTPGQRHDYATWEDFLRPGAFKPLIDVTATVQRYVIINADTYAECLAALLFGYQWKPDDRPELGRFPT